MTLFMVLVISALLFWLVLDLHAERMSERLRFTGNLELDYFKVARSYLKEICSIRDEEELGTLVWFSQGLLVLIALVVSVLVWILYLPFSAVVVTLLSLLLAVILPRRAVDHWRQINSKSIEEEVNLASVLLMVRARSDESVDHVVYDVVDAIPDNIKGSFVRTFISSLSSFRITGHFSQAMEKLNSQLEHGSVNRLSEAMSGWYADVEHGNQYLDILVREQEAVRQFKLDLNSRTNSFIAGFSIIIVLLITTFLIISQL